MGKKKSNYVFVDDMRRSTEDVPDSAPMILYPAKMSQVKGNYKQFSTCKTQGMLFLGAKGYISANYNKNFKTL